MIFGTHLNCDRPFLKWVMLDSSGYSRSTSILYEINRKSKNHLQSHSLCFSLCWLSLLLTLFIDSISAYAHAQFSLSRKVQLLEKNYCKSYAVIVLMIIFIHLICLLEILHILWFMIFKNYISPLHLNSYCSLIHQTYPLFSGKRLRKHHHIIIIAHSRHCRGRLHEF